MQGKVKPSRAARGDESEERRSRRRRRLEVIRRGANDCRGASWSDERLGANSLTATSRRGLLLSGCLRASRPSDPFLTVWYADKCARVLLNVVQKYPM